MFRHITLIIFTLLIAIAASTADEITTVVLSPKTGPISDLHGIPLLHIVTPEATSPESGLALNPAEPFQWHRDADDESPFHLIAEVDSSKYPHALLTVWNWNNRPIHQHRIEAGKPHDLTLIIEGTGSYLLTLDGIVDSKVQKRLIRNLARTADLNAARDTWTSNFFLGICTFPGRYHWSVGEQPVCPIGLTEQQARDLEASYMARLGFQVVRIDESMEMGKAKPGSPEPYIWNFDRMDAAVEAYTSRGMKLDLQLMNAPDWAILPKYQDIEAHRWRYPHIEADQRAFVRELLNRYGAHTRFVQVFNEPDQVEFWAGEPEEFITQFQFTHDEIRDFSNDLPIANGGYAFVDSKKVELFAKQLKPYIDLPSYHSHGTLETMRATFEEMKAIHENAGYENPQFVNSETGFDAWRLDQELRQAQAVVQKVLYCWANDHRGILLFCGRMAKGPGREDRDLGLLDYEFCPRFSYAAVSGLVSALAGARFERTHLQGENTFIYEFQRENDIIVAAFSLEEKGEEFTFQSNAASAVVIDPMGNETKVAEPSSISLKLDAYPAYIAFENVKSVGVVK